MADDTPTVEQARWAVNKAFIDGANCSALRFNAALDALIAAVRAEMVCPQCEAHGLPSHLIPR